MTSILLKKAPARRSIVASLLVVAVLGIAAGPASAKPPRSGSSPSNVVTLVPSEWYPGEPCTFDVQYNWSGIRGKDLSASVRLVDGSGATIASAPLMGPVSGSGWALFFFKFSGSVGDPRAIQARGSILSGGVEISTSVALSQPLATACGGPFAVASPTTVGLT